VYPITSRSAIAKYCYLFAGQYWCPHRRVWTRELPWGTGGTGSLHGDDAIFIGLAAFIGNEPA